VSGRVQLSVPVILEPRIEREELWHFLGYPAGREPPERVATLARELLEDARALTAARGAFMHLPVERAAEVGLEPIDAEALVIGLVTAGGGIEARARELVDAGEMTRGLIMDAAGSAAAEEAADLLGAQIVEAGHADANGADPSSAGAVSCRLSPGYGRWPLSVQPALFALLPHEQVGVQLLPSHMMVPRKSISFAMWLGADGPIGSGLSGCSRCTLEHCRYRRAASSSARSQPAPRRDPTRRNDP